MNLFDILRIAIPAAAVIGVIVFFFSDLENNVKARHRAEGFLSFGAICAAIWVFEGDKSLGIVLLCAAVAMIYCFNYGDWSRGK